jgi:hypothetical protein
MTLPTLHPHHTESLAEHLALNRPSTECVPVVTAEDRPGQSDRDGCKRGYTCNLGAVGEKGSERMDSEDDGFVLTKVAARRLEAAARRHWGSGRRAALRFAVELRQLQVGNAHARGDFSNFGTYAQHMFEDLSASSAKHFAWMGATLLKLEEHGRLSLDSWPLPVGNTGVRALASIAGARGDQAMLNVFDQARRDKPADRSVSGQDVKRAMAGLLPAPQRAVASAPTDLQPYEAEEDEVLAVDAVPEALRELAHDMDELLKVEWEGEVGSDQRNDVMHEVEALRARLDRFIRRIQPVEPVSNG